MAHGPKRKRKKSFYTRITSKPDHSNETFIKDLDKHFDLNNLDSNFDLYKPKINGLKKFLK